MVDRVEGILGIDGVDGIQRIVRTILIDRVEDVVVALVLLVEARIGKPVGDRTRFSIAIEPPAAIAWPLGPSDAKFSCCRGSPFHV